MYAPRSAAVHGAVLRTRPDGLCQMADDSAAWFETVCLYPACQPCASSSPRRLVALLSVPGPARALHRRPEQLARATRRPGLRSRRPQGHAITTLGTPYPGPASALHPHAHERAHRWVENPKDGAGAPRPSAKFARELRQIAYLPGCGGSRLERPAWRLARARRLGRFVRVLW